MSLRDHIMNWVCETADPAARIWVPERNVVGTATVATDLRLECMFCEEPITGRRAYAVEYPTPHTMLHPECAIRLVAGSVGHQTGRCSCHGGDYDDPPGTTPREAAWAAVRVWEARQGRFN